MTSEQEKELLDLRRKVADLEKTVTKLFQSEEKYRSIVESTDDSIYIVDRHCRYLYINKKHQGRLGIFDDAYIGKPYSEYHVAEETAWFTERVRLTFETAQGYQHEHRSRRDDNHFFLTLSPLMSSSGEIDAVCVISKNISDIKDMQEQMRILSITDDLTGVYSRRGFFSLAEHQLKVAERMKTGLFLIYADIDNLKQVNDNFGHQEGDELIRQTAEILKAVFRNSDIIARIGGDEFVVFPVEGEESTAPVAIMQRLQDKIDSANREAARNYPISLSVGYSYYAPSNPCSLEELLRRADASMYENKNSKRNSQP